MSAHPRDADENPVHGIILGCFRQEIRFRVVLPELSGNVIVAITPAKVPGALPALLLYSACGHSKSFENLFEARFVREELAIELFLVSRKVLVDLLKVPVIKGIDRCPIYSTISHLHWSSRVRVQEVEFVRRETLADIKRVHIAAKVAVGGWPKHL